MSLQHKLCRNLKLPPERSQSLSDFHLLDFDSPHSLPCPPSAPPPRGRNPAVRHETVWLLSKGSRVVMEDKSHLVAL